MLEAIDTNLLRVCDILALADTFRQDELPARDRLTFKLSSDAEDKSLHILIEHSDGVEPLIVELTKPFAKEMQIVLSEFLKE